MNANEPPMPEAEARLAAFLTAQLGREPSPDALWQRLAPHLSAPSFPGERDLMEQSTPETSSFSASTTPARKPPRRPRGPAWRIIPAAAAIVIIALVATVFATLHGQQRASVPASGTPGTNPTSTLAPITTSTGVPPGAAPQDILLSASLTSSVDGWAVGQHDDEKQDTTRVNERSLLYHLANGTWTQAALPNSVPGNIDLQAVSFDAPNDGWAVGNGLLHFDGTTWHYVPNPAASQLVAVQMLAPNVGWATSLNPLSEQDAIYFYDGTQWIAQPIPPQPGHISVLDLAMLSPTEGWAVGNVSDNTNMTNYGVILHWHGGQWSVQTSIANVDLSGISMASLTEGWAVGADRVGAPLVLHYQGATWSPYAIGTYAVDGGFGRIRMLSPTDGWMTGATTGIQDAQKSLTLLHYDGTAWRQVPTPPLGEGRIHAAVLSFAISGGTVWAVGYDYWSLAGSVPKGYAYIPKLTPLIMQLVNGVWVVAQS